jgi:hypothetical protein
MRTHTLEAPLPQRSREDAEDVTIGCLFGGGKPGASPTVPSASSDPSSSSPASWFTCNHLHEMSSWIAMQSEDATGAEVFTARHAHLGGMHASLRCAYRGGVHAAPRACRHACKLLQRTREAQTSIPSKTHLKFRYPHPHHLRQRKLRRILPGPANHSRPAQSVRLNKATTFWYRLCLAFGSPTLHNTVRCRRGSCHNYYYSFLVLLSLFCTVPAPSIQ